MTAPAGPFAIDRLRAKQQKKPTAPKRQTPPPCEHPYWQEEGDGHGHNYWRCTTCARTQWIAPWVLRPRLDES